MSGKEKITLREIFESIEEKIPNEHKRYTFWSPSIWDEEKEKYIFYAYGNPVLQIRKNMKKEIYFRLSRVDFSRAKEMKWEEEYNDARSNKGKENERLKSLLILKKEIWNYVIESFMRKAIEGTNIQRERLRETIIAKANEKKVNDSDFRIIEMESQILGCNKIPDMIGIRSVKNKTIRSYIEYKCTRYAMRGNGSILNHLYALVEYFENNKLDKDENEILFLFSHINDKNGIKAGTVFKGLQNVITKLEKYGVDVKVSFCIIDTEQGVISNKDIITLKKKFLDNKQKEGIQCPDKTFDSELFASS